LLDHENISRGQHIDIKSHIFPLLQGERKVAMLVGITLIFVIHVFGIYWWYRNDDLLRPLFMLPPKDIPPFWHAIFIIMVNGIATA
jgi:hypothetical protein